MAEWAAHAFSGEAEGQAIESLLEFCGVFPFSGLPDALGKRCVEWSGVEWNGAVVCWVVRECGCGCVPAFWFVGMVGASIRRLIPRPSFDTNANARIYAGWKRTWSG